MRFEACSQISTIGNSPPGFSTCATASAASGSVSGARLARLSSPESAMRLSPPAAGAAHDRTGHTIRPSSLGLKFLMQPGEGVKDGCGWSA
jgi:hypothetical protein